MSYTSFAQKPHFLFQINICCFCVERHGFILQTVCFVLPCWVEPLPICLKKNAILVNDLVVLKSVGFCSGWLLCFHFLFACNTQTQWQRHACTLLLLHFGVFELVFLHTSSFKKWLSVNMQQVPCLIAFMWADLRAVSNFFLSLG